MAKTYRWGILGAGKMSAKFSKGLLLLGNAELYSVGSRDVERSQKFALENGYRKAYGNYEQFASDPALDVVYIATPHTSHYENTLLCLNNGKSVICEKAFSINHREVAEMVSLAREKKLFLMEALWPPFQPFYSKAKEAREKKLFLMEALWPPFQPFYSKAKEILGTGVLGKVSNMHAWFSFKPPYDPHDRKFNLALGGGSLLDIGIYPVIDCLTFMGVPDEIQSLASFAPTGSEDSLNAIFRYSDGRLASIYSSFRTNNGIGCTLYCENGNLTVSRGRDMNQYVWLDLNDNERQEFVYNPEAMGYHSEAVEVMKCLDEGKTESDVVPLDFSLDLIKTLDRIREAAGIFYHGRD